MHASSSWREVSESSTTSCSVPTDSCETARPQPYAGVDTERRTRTRSPLRGSDDPAATRSISERTPFQCGWRGKSTTQRSPSNHTSVPTDRCETSPHSYRGVDTSGRTSSMEDRRVGEQRVGALRRRSVVGELRRLVLLLDALAQRVEQRLEVRERAVEPGVLPLRLVAELRVLGE